MATRCISATYLFENFESQNPHQVQGVSWALRALSPGCGAAEPLLPRVIASVLDRLFRIHRLLLLEYDRDNPVPLRGLVDPGVLLADPLGTTGSSARLAALPPVRLPVG